jgi:hypothetical protein
MARIKGEIIIARSVAEVFDFVSDERNEPRYNPQMVSVEQISPGPIGLGSQFRAQMKSGARTLPVLLEFTAFERPIRLGSHSSFSGIITDGELTFETLGNSTRMRWVWDIKPTGVLKMFTPLVVWMGRRQENRIWSQLKQCLEA